MTKYFMFRLLKVVIPYIPGRLGYLLANFLGDIGYVLSKKYRHIVFSNVTRVLGAEAKGNLIQKTVRGVFRNAVKNYYDLFRVPRYNLRQLEQILTIHGWEYFEKAVNEGKGVIVVTAHLGNFDLVAQVCAARSLKMTVLAEPLKPERMARLITNIRQSRGLSFLPVGMTALKDMVRSLRRGGVVAVACDRDIQKNGLRLKFLGRETTLPVGAIQLALRTGAAVVPAFTVRKSHCRFEAYVEPPVTLSLKGNRHQNVRQSVEKVVAAIEKYIRLYPEQWVVFEPIWAR